MLRSEEKHGMHNLTVGKVGKMQHGRSRLMKEKLRPNFYGKGG